MSLAKSYGEKALDLCRKVFVGKKVDGMKKVMNS
jgi:hypothetical protein